MHHSPFHRSLLAIFVVTVAAASACQGEGKKKRDVNGGAGSEVEAGTPNDTGKSQCLKGFNVINGKDTTDYPSVGLIAELDEKNVVGGTCTGTWVGSNTMITAAHCITAGALTELVYLKGNAISTGETIQEAEKIVATGVKPSKVIVNADELLHGNLQNDLIEMNVAYKDMAILIFDKDVAPATTKILDRLPSNKEDAVIVGFGATASSVRTAEAGEKSIKRVGKNHVVVRDELKEAFPDLLIMFGRGETEDTSGKATDSLSGAGDSGGPIFVDGALAGVVSNGAASAEVQDLSEQLGEDADNMTVYASLNSTFAKALLDKAKKAGAKFTLGSGAGSTEPGTGGNGASCLTGYEDEVPSDEYDEYEE